MGAILDKWKSFIIALNDQGIPIPLIRDPKTKNSSLTLSLVVLSAALCTIAILFMLAASIAKLTQSLIVNPETASQIKQGFDSSFQFLLASLAAYLGRKYQKDDKGGSILEPDGTQK